MATSSETSDQNNVKSRRPAESAFKQQRLPAWQPILTAGTVLPTFFVIGIAFIPVGIGLLYFSDEVKEYTVDYTHCIKKDDTITCADYIKQMQAANQTNSVTFEKCICEIPINLTEHYKDEVYFYYGLSNYYQNHRRYVKSRDDNQLLGRLNQPLSSDCDPFSMAYQNGVKKAVAPCGAIANSLFNDTLRLFSVEQATEVPVLRTGIAWTSDKEIKFRNPDTSNYNGSLKAAFANYTKPTNWAKHIWELDTDQNNNGFQNEDLIVWMRTAALPTFRKLYRRVNHDIDGFRTGLNKGNYTLQVEYNYPVTDFDGTKSFIISTTSLLGGKNPFLGVAYVVVGTLCLLLGIVLLIIHVRCSKRMLTRNELVILDVSCGFSEPLKTLEEKTDSSPFEDKNIAPSSSSKITNRPLHSILHSNGTKAKNASDKKDFISVESLRPSVNLLPRSRLEQLYKELSISRLSRSEIVATKKYTSMLAVKHNIEKAIESKDNTEDKNALNDHKIDTRDIEKDSVASSSYQQNSKVQSDNIHTPKQPNSLKPFEIVGKDDSKMDKENDSKSENSKPYKGIEIKFQELEMGTLNLATNKSSELDKERVKQNQLGSESELKRSEPDESNKDKQNDDKEKIE